MLDTKTYIVSLYKCKTIIFQILCAHDQVASVELALSEDAKPQQAI